MLTHRDHDTGLTFVQHVVNSEHSFDYEYELAIDECASRTLLVLGDSDVIRSEIVASAILEVCCAATVQRRRKLTYACKLYINHYISIIRIFDFLHILCLH